MSPRARLAIIWFLSLVLTASVFGYLSLLARRQARDAKRVADVSALRYALDLHFRDCYTYPLSLVSGKAMVGVGGCAGRSYLNFIPSDPGGGRYIYTPCGLSASGSSVCHAEVKKADSYRLEYVLERDYNDIKAGPHQAGPERIN